MLYCREGWSRSVVRQQITPGILRGVVGDRTAPRISPRRSRYFARLFCEIAALAGNFRLLGLICRVIASLPMSPARKEERIYGGAKTPNLRLSSASRSSNFARSSRTFAHRPTSIFSGDDVEKKWSFIFCDILRGGSRPEERKNVTFLRKWEDENLLWL